MAILRPLDRLIVKYQSDKIPISEVLPDFLNLQTEFKILHNDKVITTGERDYLIKLAEQRVDFMYDAAHGVSYLLDPVLLGGGMPSANRCSSQDALINKPIDDEQPVDDAHRRHIYLEYPKFKIAATIEKAKKSFRFQLLADRSKTPLEW